MTHEVLMLKELGVLLFSWVEAGRKYGPVDCHPDFSISISTLGSQLEIRKCFKSLSRAYLMVHRSCYRWVSSLLYHSIHYIRVSVELKPFCSGTYNIICCKLLGTVHYWYTAGFAKWNFITGIPKNTLRSHYTAHIDHCSMGIYVLYGTRCLV